MAHPDDEACCFGGLLIATKALIKWHIICCSYPRNPLEDERRNDFLRACNYIGIPKTYINKMEPPFKEAMDVSHTLEEIGLSKFDIVLTHGNWGHAHHRSIYRQVLELYKGPIFCNNPNGKFSFPLSDKLYAEKIEYLKNYKTNSVKVEGRDVEKWEALRFYHQHVRDTFEGFDVLNTEKTLNTYNRSWRLMPGVECDVHLAEYIQEYGMTNKTIFHFGTGEHHEFGKMVKHNATLGITASIPEYNIYMQEVTNDPELAKRYKVLFGDIYTLNPELLPEFDIITLFHLCEYSRNDSDYGQLDDRQLLDMFINKLSVGGLICFFTGSNHYQDAKILIEECVSNGTIKFVGIYKSVILYRAN